MTKEPVITKVLALDCGHKTTVTGKPPDREFYCHKCRVITTWTLLVEYRVKCRTCRVNRPHGANQMKAKMDASKHHRRCPSHWTDVLLGSKVLYSLKPQTSTLFDQDEPPY